MKFTRQRKKSWTGIVIDITPLIDVVFILLIFFLLTAAPSPEPELSVKLPKASASAGNTPVNIKITIKRDGVLYLNDTEVQDIKDLKVKLKRLARINPAAKVILRGDRKMYYEKFISVLEAVNNADLPLSVAVDSDESD